MSIISNCAYINFSASPVFVAGDAGTHCAGDGGGDGDGVSVCARAGGGGTDRVGDGGGADCAGDGGGGGGGGGGVCDRTSDRGADCAHGRDGSGARGGVCGCVDKGVSRSWFSSGQVPWGLSFMCSGEDWWFLTMIALPPSVYQPLVSVLLRLTSLLQSKV